MHKRRLVETVQFQLVPPDPNTTIVLDNMVSEWGAIPSAHLSVVLVHLRFLYLVHQTHHWVAKGDSFYGDHMLFQRLYEAIAVEIDVLAEKAVGMGSERNVNLPLQVIQLQRLVQGYGMATTIPQSTELAKRSLLAERNLLLVVATAVEQMKMQGILSRGVDNMLATVEDKHEEHVYILQQRCMSL
jgi:DNA-binding ferritin-like protein